MTRYGIITSYAPSLKTVGQDIAYAFKKAGLKIYFKDYMVSEHEAPNLFQRAIIFITCDPLYAHSWFLLAREYNLLNIPTLIYTTVEGEPKQHLISKWIKQGCYFISNSKFTTKMLKRVGLKVIGMVPHGVNMDMIEFSKKLIPDQKQMIKDKLNKKVIFGTVASGHPRKGLDRLSQAIEIVNSKTKDIGFVIFTNATGKNAFFDVENTLILTRFGKLAREEILSLIGALDFYIQPSLCEGFGLPVLEAQAFGIPVIYPKYEPLTEIAHPKLNYPVSIQDEQYKDLGDGILYLIHEYNPKEMADQILNAYELYTKNRQEYEARKKELIKHAESFDVKKIYLQFLKFWRD
ncbi:MAG: hypothetical protein DRP01_01625 [Archaeoglobales archaeon]|nr:MAG: hypothetical protein DRP01_01625 [Archaeoglobales archaeon]